LTEARLNPDWYRIKYSLAAECFNWAYVEAGREARASDEGVREGAHSQKLAEAEEEARALLRAVGEQLGGKAGRRRRRLQGGNPDLDDLLRNSLKPAGLILVAGIELFKRGVEESRREGELRERSLVELEACIESGQAVNPYALAGHVKARWRPAAVPVSFNLACFNTQVWRLDWSEAAWREACEHLRHCAEATAPSEWPRLQAEIHSDPFARHLAAWADAEIFAVPPTRLRLPARHFEI
jgi:hypothetical protein